MIKIAGNITIIAFLVIPTLGSAYIKVLTYNICWECMTNSSTGSAGELGKQCTLETVKDLKNQDITVSKCAINIANAIDEINDYYGSGTTKFDFVALQEAANWQVLQKLSTALSEDIMTAKPFQWGNNEFVTLFNKKYNLKHEIQGGFVDEVNKKDRPFHILIFDEQIIFVNLHNGHGNSFNMMNMERTLSNALKNNLNKQQIQDLSTYRIIVAGDFNDHHNYFWPDLSEYQLSFVPFRYAGLSTAVNFPNKPEETCCSVKIPFKSSNNFNKVSDYILDSETRNVRDIRYKVPTPYSSKQYDQKPLSDHLPVIYEAYSINQQ